MPSNKTPAQTDVPVNADEVLSGHPNATVRDMWERVKEDAAPLEEIHENIRAASPPSSSELDEWLTSSPDPEIVEFREAIKRMEDALRVAREDAHKALLSKVRQVSPEELDQLKVQYAKQIGVVRTSVGMLRDFAELMSGRQNVEGVLDALKAYSVPTLRAIGPNRGSTNQGDGAPRPQVKQIEVTRPNGASKTFDKLSHAAQWVKQNTSDVYAAWLKAAKANQWQDVTEAVEFTLNDFKFGITPRDSAE